MTYNVTQLQNSTGIIDLMTYANNSTDWILFNMFTVVIFLVIIMSSRQYDFSKSLLVASFICFIVSMLFRFAGLVHYMFIILYFILMIFSGLYVYVIDRN